MALNETLVDSPFLQGCDTTAATPCCPPRLLGLAHGVGDSFLHRVASCPASCAYMWTCLVIPKHILLCVLGQGGASG